MDAAAGTVTTTARTATTARATTGATTTATLTADRQRILIFIGVGRTVGVVGRLGLGDDDGLRSLGRRLAAANGRR